MNLIKKCRCVKNMLVLRAPDLHCDEAGFTLMETMVALVILNFRLPAARQVMFVAMGSNSLSRSKGAAMTVAQDRLELLADLRQRTGPASWKSAGRAPGAGRARFPLS